MKLKLDVSAMNRLLKSFHLITGLRIGVFTLEGECILVYPEAECAFCRCLKEDKRFHRQCLLEDRQAMRRARQGELLVYRCHGGLYEAVTPILCSGTPVACLMIGQAALEHQALPDTLSAHPAGEALYRHYAAMPRKTKEELEACTQIMAACAASIYLNSMVSPTAEPLTDQLRTYIRSNYARPVTLRDMADALQVSVTRLCTSVRAECGETPHSLLTSRRIQEAQTLLVCTDWPIRDVAHAVGIADYNYFSRIFRQHTGFTPSSFRKQKLG